MSSWIQDKKVVWIQVTMAVVSMEKMIVWNIGLHDNNNFELD
jgi:hypothetical protein